METSERNQNEQGYDRVLTFEKYLASDTYDRADVS